MAKKKIQSKPKTKVATCPCGSGKSFPDCHGASSVQAMLVPQTPELAPSSGPSLKLDLAGGQNPREGFECVDIWEGAKHVVDLQKFPWPFEDSSVAELNCSHYIEHIPMEMVDTPSGRKDALFAFFDECHRILVPDGWLTVICPNARSNRAFQDPTHRRFIVAETFLYLYKEWREANKLDHYNVQCNFAGDVNPIIPVEMNALHAEVQARRFNHEWNTIMDWQAKLKAMK